MNDTALQIEQAASSVKPTYLRDEAVSRARASFAELHPAADGDMSDAGRDAAQEIFVEEYVAGFMSSYADAQLAARQRFAAVVGAPEYAGREKSAHTLIVSTDLDAAGICAILSTIPVAQPATAVQRARDAVGGLVCVDAQSFDPAGDFARGKKLAKVTY